MFPCKESHHSALCPKRNLSLPTTRGKELIYSKSRHDSTLLCQSTGTAHTETTNDTLLLCKRIKVINPDNPQKRKEALALFDIGSQMSFISKKLSNQLKLRELNPRTMLVASFSTKVPLQCPTTTAQLSVQTANNETMTINGQVVEYLTKELQVVNVSNEEQFETLTNSWEKPDILIGADNFFKFISLQNLKKLQSGYTIAQSKLGPMIVGSGNIENF
ncbi:hypothetical protein ACH3XW_18775 [Acanthocheilonema viteae]